MLDCYIWSCLINMCLFCQNLPNCLSFFAFMSHNYVSPRIFPQVLSPWNGNQWTISDCHTELITCPVTFGYLSANKRTTIFASSTTKQYIRTLWNEIVGNLKLVSSSWFNVYISDKVKFRPVSVHESSDRQYSYSCPFSLTTALYVVVVDRYRQY